MGSMWKIDLENVYQAKMNPSGKHWLGKTDTYQSNLAKQGLFPAFNILIKIHGQCRAGQSSLGGQ